MSTEKQSYVEFTWEEWIEINDPGFNAEYERQDATSGFRGSKKGAKPLRIKNGYETNAPTVSDDLPLKDNYSLKD